jgi:hypothetical protein
VHLAYRLALTQWWAALVWGLWVLVRPSADGVDHVVASVAWCWTSVLVIVLRGARPMTLGPVGGLRQVPLHGALGHAARQPAMQENES